MARQMPHVVQIIADNTDVANGTIVEDIPTWAKHLRIQCLASDYDWLIDILIKRIEYMRQSAPHLFGADNLALPDWRGPHVLAPVEVLAEYSVNVNVNVVTAGVGLVVFQYEG